MRPVVLMLTLLGCGDDKDAAVADTGPCAEAPVLTWDNFGAGFITQECQSCHGSGVVNRQGAPEDVHFDSKEEVWARVDRVLARAGGDEPTMPPFGGVVEDDRERLTLWLTCAEPGT
ncbi:MAG: cytochrome c [Deltaproteobacteria bacterium]|nr:cytochrome c [Deltaproteobacteria bacterium]